MTKYARVKDGYLTDVWRVPEDFPSIEARDRSLGSQGWISVPDDILHGAKDNGDGSFSNIEPPAPIPNVNQWDALDFVRRFTQAERIAIRTLAKSNGQAEDFLDLLDKAAAVGTHIHADDPDVINGLLAFTTAGILGDGRSDEILGS